MKNLVFGENDNNSAIEESECLDLKAQIRDVLIKEITDNLLHKFIDLEVITLEEEHSVIRIKCSERTNNPYGFAHGGVLLTLADAAAGTTACMCGKYVTTVNANLNFLLPAKDTEYIYCESRMLRRGTHLAVYEVKIKDDRARLLDSGEFTFFITSNKVLTF